MKKAKNLGAVTHTHTLVVLKNNLKLIIGIIIGAILASSITIYAYNYYANQIGYTKDGTDIENVSQALNDLYSKISTPKSIIALQSEDKVSSISCNIGDYFIINSPYTITPNGSEVLARSFGPYVPNTGIDSNAILVRATSTTITSNYEFGYTKLQIQ